MKTTIDTEQIKRNVSLIALAGRYTELRRESSKEYSGACPKCGGHDRFHVTDKWFACRPDLARGHCGMSGDTLAFVQWVEGCDFVTACNILSGTITTAQPLVAKPVVKAPASKPWDAVGECGRVDAMNSALMAGKYPNALEYLIGRGIDLETISAFKLGTALMALPNTWNQTDKALSYPKQLAISLPWFNHDGALMAVKYRFVESHLYTDTDCKTRTENKTSRGNMAGQMFGWQALRGSRSCRTLIICEGEINALSIWQAGDGRIDVLSAGNESQLSHIQQIAISIAKNYQDVIVWADQGNVADTAARLIPGSKRFHSPVVAGYPKGADANDLLVAGKLADLLVDMTSKVSDDDVLSQVERLLEDADDDRRRDARWVYRWLAGYTESTTFTRRNVELAARRLGISIAEVKNLTAL